MTITSEKRLYRAAVAVVLEDLRRDRGILSKDLAPLLKMTPHMLSHTLNARRDLSFQEAAKICKLFGISLTRLGELIDQALEDARPKELVSSQVINQMLRQIPCLARDPVKKLHARKIV